MCVCVSAMRSWFVLTAVVDEGVRHGQAEGDAREQPAVRHGTVDLGGVLVFLVGGQEKWDDLRDGSPEPEKRREA